MRFVLAAGVLVFLGACAALPLPSERALLSAGNPRAAQVDADVRSILRGMAQARSDNERVARLSH